MRTYFLRAMAGRISRSTASSASRTFLRRTSPLTRLTGDRLAYGKMGAKGTGAGYCCWAFKRKPSDAASPMVPARWKNLLRENSFMANSYSETTGFDPETFPPFAIRSNRLQVLVDAPVRQVECIGDGGHGLHHDIVAVGGDHHGHIVLRPVDHGNLLGL